MRFSDRGFRPISPVMKRFFAVLAIAIALGASACGGSDKSSSDNDPTGLVDNPQSNFLHPPAKARDTVNQLNNKLNQEDQQTGTGYNP